MKKIVSLCLCLMLLALGATPVLAAADMVITLKADQQVLKPGDQVTITLNVQADKACNSFGVMIVYDEKIFEVMDGSCKVPGAMLADFDPARGLVAMYLVASKPNGEVGKVTLRVRADAPTGEATFTGNTSVKEGSARLECVINTLTFQITEETTQQPQEQQPQEQQPQEQQPQEQQPQEQQPQEQQPQEQQPQEQQPQEQQPQETHSHNTEPTQTEQTTEMTQEQEQTQPSQIPEINTTQTNTTQPGGQTMKPVEKENDTLLIAVIAVVVVAAVAVGGYLVLKKRNK